MQVLTARARMQVWTARAHCRAHTVTNRLVHKVPPLPAKLLLASQGMLASACLGAAGPWQHVQREPQGYYVEEPCSQPHAGGWRPTLLHMHRWACLQLCWDCCCLVKAAPRAWTAGEVPSQT